MKLLVSIIIPLYNAENYIAETITSALNQTWPDTEIIIIDDGSADKSFSIAKTFERNNVIILQQKNKGASCARNKGLTIAKGDYIQFLDADDLLSNNKIAIQMAALNGRKDCLAISRTIYFSANNYYSESLEHNEQPEEFDSPVKFLIDMYSTSAGQISRGITTVHSWLTPKYLIDKAGFWNENLSVDDDGEFFCRVALQSKSIIYMPDAVNYYRKTNTSPTLSARKDKKAMQSIFLANKLKYKYLTQLSFNDAVNKAFTKLFMENAVTFYPRYKDLHSQAWEIVKQLGGTDYVPVIGGKKIELVKRLLGWKIAKRLLYTFTTQLNK